MNRVLLVTLLLLLLPRGAVLCQQSDHVPAAAQASAQEKSKPNPQSLSNSSIVKLAQAGLGEDTIISLVNSEPGNYSLEVDDVAALKKAGVSDRVIAAMVNKAIASMVANSASRSPSKASPGAVQEETGRGAQPPSNSVVGDAPERISSEPAAGSASASAAALEAQYGTCAKHHIPAEKCTSEIYQQLAAQDEKPLDANTALAVKAVEIYRTRLKNPESLQVHVAYVTDAGDVCLEVGGQNSLGGQTVSRIVYKSDGKWLDENGFLGGPTIGWSGGTNRWIGRCTRGAFHPKMQPGVDVTDKVNRTLRALRQE